jgi:hypothetical protein
MAPMNPQASIDHDKKAYAYDQSKSFFRNLSSMIKFLKSREHLDKLKEEHQRSKKEVNIP